MSRIPHGRLEPETMFAEFCGRHRLRIGIDEGGVPYVSVEPNDASPAEFYPFDAQMLREIAAAFTTVADRVEQLDREDG